MKQFFAIENALYQFDKPLADPNTRLGDVFVSDDGLGFVPYREFRIPGLLEQGLASLLLGLGGAMMTNPNAAIKGAATSASQERTKDW